MGLTLQNEWEEFISRFPRNPAPLRTYDLEALERRFPIYFEKLKKDIGANEPHNLDIQLRQMGLQCEDFYRIAGIEIDFEYCLGEFFTGEINAAVTPAPSGYFFLINTGLRDVIFKFCKSFIWSSEFVYTHTHEACELPPGYNSKSYTFSSIADYLGDTIYIYLRKLPEDLLSKLAMPANENAALLFAYTDTNAIYFVIMHEMAHAKLGHLNRDDMMHVLPDDNSLMIYRQSQQQEHEADWLAASALHACESNGSTHYTPDESRFASWRLNSICLVLLCLDLLEEGAEVLSGSSAPVEKRTHPYPLVRIRMILALFEHQWGQDPVEAFPALEATLSWYEKIRPLVSHRIIELSRQIEGTRPKTD